jgi:hypothetical protein
MVIKEMTIKTEIERKKYEDQMRTATNLIKDLEDRAEKIATDPGRQGSRGGSSQTPDEKDLEIQRLNTELEVWINRYQLMENRYNREVNIKSNQLEKETMQKVGGSPNFKRSDPLVESNGSPLREETTEAPQASRVQREPRNYGALADKGAPRDYQRYKGISSRRSPERPMPDRGPQTRAYGRNKPGKDFK